jgi:hypothetical protein
VESSLQCTATVGPVAAAPHQQCVSQLQEQAVDAVKHRSMPAQGNLEGGIDLLAGDMERFTIQCRGSNQAVQLTWQVQQ